MSALKPQPGFWLEASIRSEQIAQHDVSKQF